MRTLTPKMLCVVLFALMPLSTQAQDVYAEMEQSEKDVDQMFMAAGKFIDDVRFNEADVTNLISLWDEWNEIGNSQYDDDEEFVDFESVLQDSEYLQWAASHDLDAQDWLRKTVRISMLLYREQMLAAAEVVPAQFQEQLDMIEQQRHQLGEELYQQMKQGLEATAQYSANITDSAHHLPEPTAAEQALLDQYRDDLMMIMGSGDDEYDEDDYYETQEDDYE